MSVLDDVANYYERLVVDALEATDEVNALEEDTLADIVCVALNRLPSRYYRHSVDMAFYMSQGEEAEMRERVRRAVQDAINFVTASKRGRA